MLEELKNTLLKEKRLAKISKKGQLVVPKEIRERLGISPGDKVEFQITERGLLIIPSRKSKEVENWRKWVGALKGIGQPAIEFLLEERKKRKRFDK